MKKILTAWLFAGATLVYAQDQGTPTLMEAAHRMARYSNVTLRGYWDMSYETRGAHRNLHAPYQLVVQRPDRLFLEFGNLRVWQDGTTLTVLDTQEGRYRQTTNAIAPADRFWLDLLPPGHSTFLEDASRASEQAGNSIHPETDATWKARSTWTLVTTATNRPGASPRPNIRYWVDQISGITVEAVAVPATTPEKPEDGWTAEQELVGSFRHHFVLQTLDTTSCPPATVFAPQLEKNFSEGLKPSNLLRVSTQPRTAAQLLNSIRAYTESE